MGDDDFSQELNEELRDLRNKNTELRAGLSTATYNGQQDPNLIELQIDASEMLGKIEHFLRGDYIAVDEDGSEYWASQTESDLILFNNYGVNSIMVIVGQYIDKNTFLSYYEEPRINEILGDLGDKLSDFIFHNYEVIGMDTPFKKTRYELTVLTIIHTIESAYRKALRGRMASNINESRIVTQSDVVHPRTPILPQKNFHPFKPNTW